MTILTRYLAREFAKNFFLSLSAFVAIYLIVEFFERINAFLVNKATLAQMGVYFSNKIPSIVALVAPASILLSAIVTLGLMSRHNEITAMKSGGISLWRISFPILGVVLFIYLALLGINEWVTPVTNQNARQIQAWVIHKKQSKAAFKRSQIWIHSNNAFYNIQLYHPEKNLLEGITIYRFGFQFRLLERVDARSARWEDGRWIFTDASVTRFPRDGAPARKNYAELVLPLPETPQDFQIAEKNPEEMNFRELQDYVSKIEQGGYNASKYRTAMHARISFPFLGVIMAFLGIPIALRKERGTGIALGVGFSIAISFFYWVFYSLGLELGKAGTLPPILAAWLGNIVFILVGFYFFLSVRH